MLLLLGKYLKLVCQSLSYVWLFGNPVNWVHRKPGTHQAPLSIGFPRQKYWRGLPFPSSGDIPNPGIEPVSTVLQADSLPLSHQGPLDVQKSGSRDFPGGPVVKTPWFQCWGTGLIPRWRTKILHGTQPKTKRNKQKWWFSVIIWPNLLVVKGELGPIFEQIQKQNTKTKSPPRTDRVIKASVFFVPLFSRVIASVFFLPQLGFSKICNTRTILVFLNGFFWFNNHCHENTVLKIRVHVRIKEFKIKK